MKLHEALSTALEFRRTENAEWEDMSGFKLWTTKDVLSKHWQVRLPSGVVVEDYQSYLYLANNNVAIDTSRLKTEASNDAIDALKYAMRGTTFDRIYIDEASDIPDLQKDLERAGFLKSSCECGSEAIGGGAHSHWCPRSQGWR